MPFREWRHRCSCEPGLRTGEPACPTCGEARESTGWAYGMHESMAAYQTLYRLKPVGAHRPLADASLRKLTVACEGCDGRGLLDAPRGCRVCTTCRGLGRVFTVPPEVVDTIRAEILRAHPDAAAEAVAGFPRVPLIHDLSSGTILGVGEQDADGEEV